MEVMRLPAGEESGLLVGTFLLGTFAREHRFGSLPTTGINKDHAWAHIWRQLAKGAVWVASDDDGIAGSLAVSPQKLWWTDREYLSDGWFYVRPEKRASRAAVLLLKAAEAFAAGLPLEINVFHAGEPERVGKFLCRLGYQPLGGRYIKET